MKTINETSSFLRSLCFCTLAILSAIFIVSCSQDIDEFESNPESGNFNEFSSYNNKTILAPVGGQGYVFPETAVFVNGKLLTTTIKIAVSDVDGNMTYNDQTVYSSLLRVPDYTATQGGIQVFELNDALLDKEIEIVLTPGFTDTPKNLAAATPAGREEWQKIKVNLKKQEGTRVAVYKTVDGKANIKLIHPNANNVAAPKPGYFKFRVLNLSQSDVVATLASEYGLPDELSAINPGEYSDYIELPYGSFRFLFNNGGSNALREVTTVVSGFSSAAVSTPFLPLQEYSSNILINNPGTGMQPYGVTPVLLFGEQLFDAVEQAYYAGGVYTAVVYPKDDSRLLFTTLMDNLRNFSPQQNVGKITLVNATTGDIQATIGNGTTLTLASGAFSIPLPVTSQLYTIASSWKTTQVNVTNNKNVYLFAVETSAGEKKWVEVNYPTAPEPLTDQYGLAVIYTRYFNFSPDAGTVDFVYRTKLGSGDEVTTRLGKEKWEGQNLSFAEAIERQGFYSVVTNKIIFHKIPEITPADYGILPDFISGTSVAAIGVAKSTSNNDVNDGPGRVISAVPFVSNPYGSPAQGASYTVLLLGKTSNASAKIVVHKHLF